MTQHNRREFLTWTAASLAAIQLAEPLLAAQEESPAGVPKRPLGKTGEKVSIIGLGGYHIGTLPEKEAVEVMHEAIDQGITFFDNSWDYHMGGSEEVVGKALAEPRWRDKVFLMTKVCARDYDGCKKQLEESLRRLRTDRLDLWQFHEINYEVDPQWLVERGAIKYALEAKKAGKVRYIGFTGHKDIDIHLAALAKSEDWNTVQMPVNPLDPHYRSFIHKVVPECNRRGVAVVGMKALASGLIPRELGIPAEVCRRFALSQPISTLVCGIASRKDLQQDLSVARNFKPMSAQEMAELLAKTKEPGQTGKHEPFKTTRRFDSRYHRQQHGIES